jgi:hypothetical protein
MAKIICPVKEGIDFMNVPRAIWMLCQPGLKNNTEIDLSVLRLRG